MTSQGLRPSIRLGFFYHVCESSNGNAAAGRRLRVVQAERARQRDRRGVTRDLSETPAEVQAPNAENERKKEFPRRQTQAKLKSKTGSAFAVLNLRPYAAPRG